MDLEQQQQQDHNFYKIIRDEVYMLYNKYILYGVVWYGMNSRLL